MDEKLQNSQPGYVENDKTININVINNMGLTESVKDIKSDNNITKTEDKKQKPVTAFLGYDGSYFLLQCTEICKGGEIPSCSICVFALPCTR